MSLPKLLPVLRLATFGTTLVFAAVLLGLNAHLTYWTEKYIGGYFRFAVLSIASACLTLITLPIMIAVDMTRNGAVSSMVAFELGWLFILWSLWLASAAKAASTNRVLFPDSCGFGSSFEETVCREFAAVVAFHFLTWFAFLAYTAVVLVASVIAKSRGAIKVWTASVGDISRNLSGGENESKSRPEPHMLIPQQPFGTSNQGGNVGTLVGPSIYQVPQQDHNAGYLQHPYAHTPVHQSPGTQFSVGQQMGSSMYTPSLPQVQTSPGIPQPVQQPSPLASASK